MVFPIIDFEAFFFCSHLHLCVTFCIVCIFNLRQLVLRLNHLHLQPVWLVLLNGGNENGL